MKICKKVKIFTCIILVLAMVFAFTGCSEAKSDGGMGSYAPEYSSDIADASKPENGEFSDVDDKPIVKQLTAAEWRDALNYELWLKLFEKGVDGEQGEQTVPDGIFNEFLTTPRGLNTFDMREISVTCDGKPVPGATVRLYKENEVIYSAMSDSAGKAYVFGNGTTVEAISGEFEASVNVAEGVTNIELADFLACEDELEIMLVVDTTGSMGDELGFLCEELAGVVKRVSAALNCEIRLGLLFYRDNGDEYVTRNFDFTVVSSEKGLNDAVKNIRAQVSSGGGDYPEAVDRALSEAVNMSWHENSKTRLLFHVLDAPYHDQQENQSVFANSVKSAAQKGIRIIPVAASGLNILGQYTMRSAALLTGGTYTFLTDDSGIGDSHELPAVGEFTVEYLSDLMVRLIKGYYTGTFDEPILWSQSNSVE